MNYDKQLRNEIIKACKNHRLLVEQADVDDTVELINSIYNKALDSDYSKERTQKDIINGIYNGGIGIYGIAYKFSPVLFSEWIIKFKNKSNVGI